MQSSLNHKLITTRTILIRQMKKNPPATEESWVTTNYSTIQMLMMRMKNGWRNKRKLTRKQRNQMQFWIARLAWLLSALIAKGTQPININTEPCSRWIALLILKTFWSIRKRLRKNADERKSQGKKRQDEEVDPKVWIEPAMQLIQKRKICITRVRFITFNNINLYF